VIIHQIPKVAKREKSTTSPIISDLETPLDSALKRCFRERITTSLAARQFAAVYKKPADEDIAAGAVSPIPQLVLDFFTGNGANFIPASLSPPSFFGREGPGDRERAKTAAQRRGNRPQGAAAPGSGAAKGTGAAPRRHHAPGRGATRKTGRGAEGGGPDAQLASDTYLALRYVMGPVERQRLCIEFGADPASSGGHPVTPLKSVDTDLAK